MPIKDSGVHLLPAGRGLSASIVARAGRFAELLAEWRRRFDWTIIDTPPLTASTAACMAAEHASGSLLVLRAGRTRPEVLDASLARLREGKAPVLGTVLNRRRYMIPHGAYRRL